MFSCANFVWYYGYMEYFCDICPRNCRADRKIKTGFCGATNKLVVAHADLHFGEEPFISGTNGSGAIFFSHCNLKCVFCQNAMLRDGKIGKEITINHLVEIIKKLENRGAHNINLVSGMHYSKQIIEALKIYKPAIPIVWNSNGYEKVETIKELAEYVDVFLPDLKFFDTNISQELAHCPNYFEFASKAILEMKKQKPNNIYDKNGTLRSGVVVRHLVLPNRTKDSKQIIDFVSSLLPNTTICIMSQYVPLDKALSIPSLSRRLMPIEYNNIVSYAKKRIKGDIFIQEMSSATVQMIPNWNPGNL